MPTTIKIGNLQNYGTLITQHEQQIENAKHNSDNLPKLMKIETDFLRGESNHIHAGNFFK